jgi:hypothetical protein
MLYTGPLLILDLLIQAASLVSVNELFEFIDSDTLSSNYLFQLKMGQSPKLST